MSDVPDERELSNPEQNPRKTPDHFDSLAASLTATFLDHPGFMTTGGGVEILHADWPAYPIGHGAKNALAALGDFPSDTTFVPIDNIDECTLFVVGKERPKEMFDRKHYHVALWDEDLRECVKRRFVDGPTVDFEGRVEFPTGQMMVSTDGQHAMLVDELTSDISPSLMGLVEEFLYLGRYDTAIREATLFVETKMRAAAGSRKFGQELIEECFGESGRLLPARLTNATKLEIRSAYRLLFRYVRNDFAHNFRKEDLVTTTRLLRRCSRLVGLLEAAASQRYR